MRKRVKPACIHCHEARKTCDRGHPCARCVKHGLSATCVDYVRRNAAATQGSRAGDTYPAIDPASALGYVVGSSTQCGDRIDANAAFHELLSSPAAASTLDPSFQSFTPTSYNHFNY
ncbi:hypothetical protein L226DRAFT_270638 [Lentinus tigrinus ALCF2SS1-7]|uniref:Transcription activator of gluconeogenesis ERT1 n=1 Tax=Lentinus tigrinus ALCF2SS1-6 TaxID=1328759 RepID=A0A5C2S907_9APHY|nr:hypothetical protein L227DRAFT_575297 [Lentinus tigrinus ALCF2SS1-6]RPD69501.1 hypothetical protein L226DRAFT_270638 [Lentinus tigrinus ALCF2SS1-7]